MLLEEIETELRRGRDIETVLEKHDWRKFENIIAEIFQENSFHTKQNFRFKTKRRYEIDILAMKTDMVFCIDCKWWGRGRYKKTALKSAVDLQESRSKEFGKFLKKNIVARSLLKVNKFKIYPLLVTLHDEAMIKERETFIIPIWKLNRFVTEMEDYF